MKICQQCGTQLRDEEESCYFCGRKQSVPFKAPQNEPRNDSDPKTVMLDGPEPIKEYAPKNKPRNSDAADTNKRDNRKGVVLVIITVLLLALIGGTVTYLVLNGKSGKGGDGSTDDNTVSHATNAPDTTDDPNATAEPEEPPMFKIGVILLHDELSPYDNNFIVAVKAAQKELGLTDAQVVIRRNVAEGNECYEAARELVAKGCDVIFADSFGHEDYMIKAAKEFHDVQFCHATGTKAHTEKLANYHNAYAAIYDGRYLTGIAAGLKLEDMMSKDPTIVPKIGFVGTYSYAEVISSYTAFYLGVKEIVPEVTMEVEFTGSWYDEAREKAAANELISHGCVIISQYADSLGAPSACESAGVINVAYNTDNTGLCPNTFLIGSRINWTPYFKYICTQALNGDPIDTDWVGTMKNGAVEIFGLNNSIAAPDTQTKVNQSSDLLKMGMKHVFDATKFTVDGKFLITYRADVDFDYNYAPDTEAISGGYFHESEYRSAPYFDIKAIDGITLLNDVF